MDNTTTQPSFSVTLPWVESPFFKTELAASDLDPATKELLERYAEDGYLIFDPEIPESVIDDAIRGVAGDVTSREPARQQDAWRTVPAAQQIATAPRVMELLRLMYRREPIPFQTLNFSVGTQQRTHSDSIHFNSIPQRFMCGVWVALEDVRDDNGPLHYFPGSHKLPFYDLTHMGLRGSTVYTEYDAYHKHYKNYEDFISGMIDAQGLKKATLNIKKGQAILWSANLLHGGEAIKTPGSTRHSQVTHYFFDDCIYYTPLRSDALPDRLYIRQITNIATGERIKNKYFDKELEQSNEGYAFRLSVPPKLLKLAAKLPTPIKRLLGR